MKIKGFRIMKEIENKHDRRHRNSGEICEQMAIV